MSKTETQSEALRLAETLEIYGHRGTQKAAAELRRLDAENKALRARLEAPAKGEVLVEVSGRVGSGKSAICGEIEIMCLALGLDVSWPGGDPEKAMTHADWTAALEAYKPRVRIVERDAAPQAAAKNGGAA